MFPPSAGTGNGMVVALESGQASLLPGMTPPLHGILDPLGSRRLTCLSIVIALVGQGDRLLSSQQRIQELVHRDFVALDPTAWAIPWKSSVAT